MLVLVSMAGAASEGSLGTRRRQAGRQTGRQWAKLSSKEIDCTGEAGLCV
jgi:hypothetical protein